MNKQYKIRCHIMHYKSSQVFYIICSEDMMEEIKTQLLNTNVVIGDITEI